MGLSSAYTMYAVNGVMAITMISLAAVLLTELLEIRETKWRMLAAGVLVTFPTVAGILSYMQTADGYALSILLAVAGCCFLQYRAVWSFLAAVVCFTVSTGIYQAYITYSGVMPVFHAVVLFFIAACLADGLKTVRGWGNKSSYK